MIQDEKSVTDLFIFAQKLFIQASSIVVFKLESRQKVFFFTMCLTVVGNKLSGCRLVNILLSWQVM